MIAKQQTGRAIDHVRAFVFLLGSLLAGSLLVLLGFQLQSDGSSLASLARRFVGGTLGLVLAGTVLTTLMAVALTFAWRVAGRRIELQQITLIMAYLVSGAWLAGRWRAGLRLWRELLRPRLVRRLCASHRLRQRRGSIDRAAAASRARPAGDSGRGRTRHRRADLGADGGVERRRLGRFPAGLRRHTVARAGRHRRLAAAARQRARGRWPRGQTSGDRVSPHSLPVSIAA
ncbi:hypothetical protein FSC37_17875 [Piscinibacter aquaticus]|uniref:Uncharacterized protein n=1 Tax=Piscinibacter aquaticus TaxID=392597 RepID=A0A5C6U232_9BURK|nr:hypothetical protein FSC37_17875 [Piscinibacter aquaticus]